MIISQRALCEECRDGSCRACKNYLRRQKRRYPHAKKSHVMLETAMKQGMPVTIISCDRLEPGDVLGLPEAK